MNLDNGEKGSNTGLLDALNTSIVWLLIRVLSIYVASPATLPVNSATLFYVTTIAIRRRAFHYINGNSGNAGDTGFAR